MLNDKVTHTSQNYVSTPLHNPTYSLYTFLSFVNKEFKRKSELELLAQNSNSSQFGWSDCFKINTKPRATDVSHFSIVLLKNSFRKIRNMIVQNEGGESNAVWTMLKKNWSGKTSLSFGSKKFGTSKLFPLDQFSRWIGPFQKIILFDIFCHHVGKKLKKTFEQSWNIHKIWQNGMNLHQMPEPSKLYTFNQQFESNESLKEMDLWKSLGVSQA